MPTVRQVERLFTKNGKVMTISGDGSVAAAAKGMSKHGIGCLVVMDRQLRVCGIITERDIIAKVVAPAADPAGTKVADVMTNQVVSCSMDTDLDEAKRIMGQYGIRHLPIIEGNIVRGMISSRDIMMHQLTAASRLAEQQSELLAELERYHPGITRVEQDSAGRLML
jgi:CBS domain-containing protein